MGPGEIIGSLRGLLLGLPGCAVKWVLSQVFIGYSCLEVLRPISFWSPGTGLLLGNGFLLRFLGVLGAHRQLVTSPGLAGTSGEELLGGCIFIRVWPGLPVRGAREKSQFWGCFSPDSRNYLSSFHRVVQAPRLRTGKGLLLLAGWVELGVCPLKISASHFRELVLQFR